MESDLGLEGRVHLQLARVDHRVFWWTQRKIEGHRGNKGRPKEMHGFFYCRRRRRGR